MFRRLNRRKGADITAAGGKTRPRAQSVGSTISEGDRSPSLASLSTRGSTITAPVPPPTAVVLSPEDSPADLLEGRVELNVTLPSGHQKKMFTERRTPMMDLLIQLAKANNLQPGDHALRVYDERRMDHVQYQPNTPIGALETTSVFIVPKSVLVDPGVKRVSGANFNNKHQPFEKTVRLQVNLPGRQLYVTRLKQSTPLIEVLHKVCHDKDFNPDLYEFRNPKNENDRLKLNSTIADYHLSEVTLVSVHHRPQTSAISSDDILAMQKSSIGKAKTKSSVGDSSVSSDSLVDATGSRGASPDLPPPLTRPLSDAAMTGGGPKRPGSSMSVQTGYKKRPAPRPPSFIEGTKVVSNSSDASSGFHEGDRARSPDGFPSSNHSGPPQVAPTNLKGSLSTSSLSLASSSGGRSKRRAPPPPKVSHPTGTARSLSTPSSNTPPSAASPRRSTTLPASSSLPSPEEEATPIAPPSASSPSPSPSFSSEHSSTVSVSATDPSLPPSPRPADPVEGGQSPHTPPTPGPAHSLPHRNKRRAPLPPPLRSPTPNSPVLPASDRARPVPRERAPSDVPGLNPRPPMLRSDSVRSASGSESESPTSRGDLGKWSGVLTDLSAIGEEPVVTLPQNRANSKPDEEEQARTMSLSSEEEEDEPLSELPPPPRESPTPPPITAEETPSAGESPMPPPITTEKTPSAVESPTPPPTTAEETPSQRERQTPSPITAEEDKGVAEESVQPEEEIVNVFRNREAEDLDSSRVSDIFEELERSIGEEPPTPSPASSKKTDGGARTPSRLLETPSTGITTDSEEEEEDQVVASSSPLPRKQLSREDFFDVLIPPLPNDQRFSPIPSTVIKRDRAFPKDFEDPGMIRHADADYADDQWESVGSFYIQPGRVVEDLTLPVHEEMEVMEEDRMEEDEEEEERSLTPSIVAVAPPVEFKDPSPLPPSSSEGSEVEDDDFSPRPDSGASIQDSGVAELGSDRIRASSVSSCDSTSAPTSDGGMATPPKSATPPARPTAPKPNTAPARSISFQIRPYSSENVPRVVTVARDLPTSVPAEPVKPPGQPNPQVEEAASIVIRPYEPWKKTGLLVTKQDSGSDPLPNSEVREPLVTANMNRSKSIPSSTFPRPLKKQPESMIETSTFPRKSEPSSSGTPFGSRMMNRPWVVRKSNAFNKSGLLSSSTLDLSSRPKEFVPMDPALELERGRLSLRHVELPPWQQEEQEPSEPSTPSPKQSVEETLKPASVPLSAVLVKRSLSKTSLNEIGLQQSRSVEEGEEELVKEEALNYQSAREKFQEMVKTTTTTFRTSSSGDIIPSKSVNILPDGSPEQPRESEGMSTPSDAVHRTEVHHPVNSSIYRGPPSTGGTFRSASSNLSNGSLPRQPSEQRTPSPTSLNKLPVRDQILRLSRMPSAQLNRYMQGRDDSDEDVEAEDKPNPWRTQTSSVSTAISSPSPSADEYRTPPTRPVPFSSPAIVATKDTAVPLTKANIFDAPVAPVANGLGSGSSVRTSAPAFTITSAKPQIQPSSILDGGPTPPSRRTPPYKPPSTGGGLRFGPETPTPSNTGFQQPKKSILLVDKAKTGGLGRQRHQTPPKEVHFEKVEPFRHSSGGSLTNGGGPRGMSPQPRSVRFASGDEPPRDTPKVIGFQQSPVSSIPAPPPPPMPSPAAEGGPPPPPMNEFEKVKMNLGTTSKRIVPTNREVTRNPRDVLMESIRDFGKRGQLKSVRC